MRLSQEAARSRLATADHGVLCTLHPARGVDAVPVTYALVDHSHVGIPVDRVKPKASVHLQRERNLAADPRATLLVEQWDRADWSRLWWVRVELRWVSDAGDGLTADLAARLAARYPQYHAQPFERVLVLGVVGMTGWAAAG